MDKKTKKSIKKMERRALKNILTFFDEHAKANKRHRKAFKKILKKTKPGDKVTIKRPYREKLHAGTH